MDRVGDDCRGVPAAHIAEGGFNRPDDGWRISGIRARRLGTD
jgi:hypothetical protein